MEKGRRKIYIASMHVLVVVVEGNYLKGGAILCSYATVGTADT